MFIIIIQKAKVAWAHGVAGVAFGRDIIVHSSVLSETL
jgi:hypothetical protein